MTREAGAGGDAAGRAQTAARAIDLAVPGDPAARTGGYIYDRRILAALATRGWRTSVHRLDDSFPAPTAAAVAGAAEALARIPADRIVVLDGLALPGLAEALRRETRRLRLVALVHHPVALESGLAADAREAVAAAEQASLAEVRGVIVTSGWTARTLEGQGVAAARIRVVEPGTDPVEPGTDPVGLGVDAPERGTHTGTGTEALEASGGPLEGRGGPLESRGGPHESRGGPLESLGGKAGATYRLLCVGTVTPRKGHALLIEALAPLRDRTWVLDCVGSTDRDPGTVRTVRELIAAHGLANRVRLLGEIAPERMSRCYRDADAFVLASELEGYGMALAEAVAHGLPIVTTTAGAIPETVPDGAGLLVPPGDRSALTAALARLLDDPDLRRRLEAAARAGRAGLPTWAAAGARFAAALEELAA